MFPTLKRGSKGDVVKILQHIIGVKVDGSFGPGTEKAIREVQQFLGLKVDGVVGDNTWNKLL